MREIKVPGEVRQLVKKWRYEAACMAKFGSDDIVSVGARSLLVTCADELEAALKRPVQRLRKLAKKGKRK